MRTTTRSSSPAAALALLLLLALCFLFHCAAAARPLPSITVPLAHQENDGVKAVAADELVLQEDATGNGDEVSELMGAAAEDETCEEGNDECMQRRMLRDAHLDYIYTQRKNKP